MNIIAIFEDEDDLNLVAQILRTCGIERKPKTISLKGYDGTKLRSKLKDLASGDLNRLVLVLDADHEPVGGPAKRWKEVLSALRETGFAIPEGVSTDNGLIYDLDDKRRVAVWLFPDCKSPGALEEFIMQTLVPVDDVLLKNAQTVVGALEERRFPSKYDRKAEVRTWLAWQKRPGLPPGRAIAEKVLVPDETRLGPFLTWLRQAFT
jgi:hypothetical protein